MKNYFKINNVGIAYPYYVGTPHSGTPEYPKMFAGNPLGTELVNTDLECQLKTELAAITTRAEKAEADTARMDWLEKESPEDWGIRSINRAAIDKAMKEAIK